MSPNLLTWVPPQSSTEKLSLPMVRTRTESPYFSPKRAIAPFFIAVSMSVSSVLTSELPKICVFTIASTLSNSALETSSS